MAVLYWKPCYNEARYNEVGLYMYLDIVLVLKVKIKINLIQINN